MHALLKLYYNFYKDTPGQYEMRKLMPLGVISYKIML